MFGPRDKPGRVKCGKLTGTTYTGAMIRVTPVWVLIWSLDEKMSRIKLVAK